MTEDKSIAEYFALLQADADTALTLLCDYYYEKLAVIARRRFGEFPRRVTDEYAVANGVLQAFHQRSQRGEFAELRDQAELLFVLSRMTRDQVVDEIRRHSAQKRGAGRTRGHSIFQPDTSPNRNGDFDRFQAHTETPSSREMLEEQCQQLLERLPDAELRTILVLRFEGLTNEEIAEHLQVSLATVERKRRRIRELLADAYPCEGTSP